MAWMNAAQSCATNPMGEDCMQLFAEILGLGVVLGATTYKLPQIIKIYSQGNAKGISLATYFLEIIVVTFTLASSLAQAAPFSTYGEGVFILLQNLIVIAQICFYENAFGAAFILGALFYCGYAAFLASGFIPLEYWDRLVTVNTCIMVYSRIPQITSNMATHDVKSQSLITWALNFLGSLARVFTTLKKRSDQTFLLGSYIIGAFLNGVIAAQIAFYKEKKKKQ